ncbi:MAG: 4Fe-4S binding protein [Planctomycetota bacterium]
MYALEMGHLNAGTIFFAAAILSTVIFGRFFCGWACHIVALQDMCSYLLKRTGIRLKPLRSRLLVLMPFLVAFYMFC